jgi:uncharacterized protein (TIGR03067 family)
MKTSLIAILAAIVGLYDKPKEDIDRFQGTWVGTRSEVNGTPQKAPPFTVKVTFDGDKLLTTLGKGKPELEGTFKLDPKREPHKGYEVTTPRGVVTKGIYELDGDTLKVCLGSTGDEAPKAFETEPLDGRTLIVYKREKPTKGK